MVLEGSQILFKDNIDNIIDEYVIYEVSITLSFLLVKAVYAAYLTHCH